MGKECIAISKSFESEASTFVLGNGKFPHMTVFMACFANGLVPQVIEATERVLRSADSFYCEHSGYFMTEGRYLEISYRRSPECISLYGQLIHKLAPLRITPGHPYEEGYFTPSTAEQRRNVEETGYDLARNLYRPHVTLTRYKEGTLPKEFPAFPKASLSFNLTEVCIYEADDNRAVFRLLRTFAI